MSDPRLIEGPVVRHAPRPQTAIVVFLIYLALFYGVWIVTGVDYETIGDSAGHLLKWYVAPTWVGGLFLIIAVSWLGWWRPVLFEKERAQPRWILLAPAFAVVTLVVLALTADFSGSTGAMFAALFLGSIGVGVAEEVSTRGVLITGFRARLTEPWVWFYSCLLFGLLHLPNWVFGAGPGAVGQVLMAFGAGSTFYLLRRVSGTLIWAMVLHAAWDFVTIGGDLPGGVGALVIVNSILGLVVGIVFLRRQRGQMVEQAGVPTAAAGGSARVSAD
ncbi:CPBP family intramembrane glutamic endopeptidase [Gordonia rhizosphera]|uniref:CAAX prenyl protease 2/Lysostaphin resistance protein A-like domain-containing protein n=1 Tax=Gordonia rhizosphera NBRC 16068 TaxID=1108045 RepID=K6WRP4_9ACTN|nr:CPBP family intramembrane glutamic endopeptidase [Gordonia rhizosphera]GAB89224.1 hypothetical protein GORHZ_055_00070 [Gordonia rhizosphera NBRC 16068]